MSAAGPFDIRKQESKNSTLTSDATEALQFHLRGRRTCDVRDVRVPKLPIFTSGRLRVVFDSDSSGIRSFIGRSTLSPGDPALPSPETCEAGPASIRPGQARRSSAASGTIYSGIATAVRRSCGTRGRSARTCNRGFGPSPCESPCCSILERGVDSFGDFAWCRDCRSA